MCVGGGGRVTAQSVRRGQGAAIGRQSGGRQVTGFNYNKKATFRKDETQTAQANKLTAVNVPGPSRGNSPFSAIHSRRNQVQATTDQADGALVNTVTKSKSFTGGLMGRGQQVNTHSISGRPRRR